VRGIICCGLLLLVAACTGATGGAPATSRVTSASYRIAANAPTGEGLTVSGAHSSTFGRFDSICDPMNFSGDNGFIYGVMTHQTGAERYSLSLWLPNYTGPGTYQLGAHGSTVRDVSLGYESVSPADQQAYGTATGVVVVASDDHGVARGSLDVELTAASFPGGFPPDAPIHVTGTWSCPRLR
jgi:hypothetical protein